MFQLSCLGGKHPGGLYYDPHIKLDNKKSLIQCQTLPEDYILYCDFDHRDSSLVNDQYSKASYVHVKPKSNARNNAKYDVHPVAIEHGAKICNGYYFVRSSYYEKDWHDFFGHDITLRQEMLAYDYFQFYSEDPLYNESCKRIFYGEFYKLNKMQDKKAILSD